jgi:hypothetical protein
LTEILSSRAIFFADQNLSLSLDEETPAGKGPATKAIATGPDHQLEQGLAKPPQIHPSAIVITLMNMTIDANLRSWRIRFAVVSALFNLRAI